MQYMLLCYHDEKRWEALPEAQRDQVMDAYGKWTQDIVKSGHFRASAKLRPTSATTSVREHHGKRVVLDGPFAETKEQLGGFHIIDVPDLDSALAWAARCPSVRRGVVEVRPVWPV